MKLLVFAVCALACLTLANTKPCRGDTCGGYNNKRQYSYGGYKSQVGSHAGQASTNANMVGGGTGMEDSDYGYGYGYGIADISGNSADKEGTDDVDGGGRYHRYNGYRRNNNVESIGRGGNNLNTVIIPSQD